jgi:hypothetical protein
MKSVLIFWGGPVLFIAGWYWLSYYNLSFGMFFFSRQLHDLVFQIYGKILGMPPADIPPLVARAIGIDSVLVFSLLAFRRRAKIAAWWRRRQASRSSAARASDESLSKAP